MGRFAKKVVLNSVSGYSSGQERFLEELLNDGVQLFCAVGRDCELWHDVMDEVIVGDGSEDRFSRVITTWHNDEPLDEVIAFAATFDVVGAERSDVQVIQI